MDREQLIVQTLRLLEDYDRLQEQYLLLLEEREKLSKNYKDLEYRLEEEESRLILEGLEGKNEQARKAYLRQKLSPLHDELHRAERALKSMDSKIDLIKIRYYHLRDKILVLKSVLRSMSGEVEDV